MNFMIIFRTDEVDHQTMQNRLCRKSFILHFGMRREKPAAAVSKNGCRKTLGTNSLLIRFEDTGEQLPDSVFELELYQRDASGHRQFMGRGRGYLVFEQSVLEDRVI